MNENSIPRADNQASINPANMWKAWLLILRTCWNPNEVVKGSAILAIVILRTYLSNSLAGISGDSFRYLLKGKHGRFVQVIGTALIMGFLQALFMPMLDILEGELSEAWRIRITRMIVAKYFMKLKYYSLSIPTVSSVHGTNGSSAIQPDQTIVDDVDSLTRSIANLWSEFAKPAVDFVWFSRSVYILTGWKGLGSLGLYMVSGSFFLASIRPNLGALASRKEQLDGEFLTVHARLSQCSESICLLEGGQSERKIIDRYFKAKIDHQVKQKRIEHLFGVPDQFVTFFLPQSASWILSMLYKESKTSTTGDILIRDLRYLGSVVNQCFSSLGYLVQLGTVWATTRGHLERVARLIDRLESLESGPSNVRVVDLQVSQSGRIELENVDIVPPTGHRVLVEGLHLTLQTGIDKGLMLSGCNGSGKSSVLKCMSGLIIPAGGLIHMVPTDVHFIPTKPYLAEGSIADQVTYPRIARRDRDRNEVMDALMRVKVAYLDDRGEGVFGSFSDCWDTKLSLGEQQRIAVARLLFHSRLSSVRFAFLDECTSAVALDGEEDIYREITARGLCCVTASQKPWLLHFHSKVLQLMDRGKWDLSEQAVEVKKTQIYRLPDVVYEDARQDAIQKETASVQVSDDSFSKTIDPDGNLRSQTYPPGKKSVRLRKSK